MTSKRPVGRPDKEPTTLIAVPVDKIGIVEKILKRPVAENQTPIVKVRVPKALVETIRNRLKKGK